jgi:hypothetical protein
MKDDSEVYRDGRWCIVDRDDYRGPWIVHLCDDADERSFPKWNYVSKHWAYSCVGCFKEAPEKMITLLELYR